MELIAPAYWCSTGECGEDVENTAGDELEFDAMDDDLRDATSSACGACSSCVDRRWVPM